MKSSILKIKNLIKQYDTGFILDIPRLEFQSGNIYSLIGSNGAGKTTLLNILNLLEQSEGKIFFKGQKISNLNSLDIRRKMGAVTEDPFLFRTTVFKNIIAGLKCRKIDKKTWPDRVKESLKMVNLEGFEKKSASTLSRGQRQRVAITRTLVLKPEILFLDEPFTNIDKKNVDILEKLIKKVNREYHTTVIFTTHDLLQAYRLSHKVISLAEGRIVRGSLENIFSGIVEENNGLQYIKISSKISISIVTGKKGRVHISIPPQDIILSHKEFLSSAKNSFKGIIKKVQIEGQIAKINISIDDSAELTALITKSSYQDMKLSIDSYVFLTFKSTSVTIF
jgi:tungstate transport system ATP-binding protein